GAARRAGRNGQRDRTLDRRHLDLCAQHRLRDRHRQIQLDVVAGAAQVGIGTDVEIQIEIAGDAVIAARLRAFARDAQPPAVLHAGRNRDIDRFAAARADGPLRSERRLGEADGKLTYRIRATGLAGPGAAPLDGPAAAALVAEQAGEDVADVEVAAEL